MREKRTLLIDGDTLAFIAASAVQHTIESADGMVEHFARRPEGEAVLDNMISRLKGQLKGTDMLFFLSCPSGNNWRLLVSATYKSNRKNSVRPMLLDALKDYLRMNYAAKHLHSLEADDVLGIYATHPTLVEGEKIVVGRDKDFATIPGNHYQLKDNDDGGRPIVRTINAREAQLSHYSQALSGDAIDGFPGCPGIGKKRARQIVENPVRLVCKDGVITRGARKGQKVLKWHEAGPCSIWEAIVCNYEKAGKTEADALETARLAKILLAGDYDFENHVVRLWEPGDD